MAEARKVINITQEANQALADVIENMREVHRRYRQVTNEFIQQLLEENEEQEKKLRQELRAAVLSRESETRSKYSTPRVRNSRQ
ncbi:hypothetical protein PIIN_11055 [Serendipita indica DSM 11827]|uniref:Uncharacterized protein n=1 Tax=Serendipita indica (strain DSM 11827) TaxID=1109443 RepID=G4U0H7_SERID|nr:hypothetical protein PIIN_11055 [Serendipita indica DSM 11827]